jgi:hypothetical protein
MLNLLFFFIQFKFPIQSKIQNPKSFFQYLVHHIGKFIKPFFPGDPFGG